MGVLRGRDHESAAMAAVIDDLAAGGVIVTGDAGMGKSELVASALSRAAADGHPTLHVLASEAAADLPLGAFAAHLPPSEHTLGGAMPMLIVARDAVLERAGGRRLVLGVDDLPLLDDASSLLVQQLIGAGDAVLVASQRRQMELPSAIAALWRAGRLATIEVGPLDRASADALAVELAGMALDDASLGRLWELGAGNPLWIRELIASARAGGHLVVGNGIGSLSHLPLDRGHLADVVRQRVDALDDDQRNALRTVAFAEPIGLSLLEQLHGPDAVLELEAAGLVRAETDRRRTSVRLVHPLHGEAIRQQTSALRARATRRDLAAALAATGTRRRSDVLRLASLAVDGGFQPPPGILLTGAQQAFSGRDLDLAERLGEAAFDAEPSFAAAHVLLDVTYETGRADEHAVMAERARPLADNDERRALLAMSEAITHFWRRADAAAAFACLDEARRHQPPGPWLHEIVALEASLMAMSGHIDRAFDLAWPMRELGPSRAHVQASLALFFALRGRGRAAEVETIVSAALHTYAQLGPQFTLIAAPVLEAGAVRALIDLGSLAEAERRATVAIEQAQRAGDSGLASINALNLGWCLYEQGRPATAVQWLRRAAAGFREHHHPGMYRWVAAAAALCGVDLDDTALVDRRLAEINAIGPHPAGIFDIAILRARAWRARMGHDRERCVATLRAAAAAAADHAPYEEAACWYDLAWLTHERECAERLRDLAARVDGPMVAVTARFAAGIADQDASALAEAGEAFSGLGAHLRAATAFDAGAAAAARGGDQRLAARLAHQATDATGRCETALTTEVVSVDIVVPLTRREREIAHLAARGEASKAIAATLFLSTRTVDNHLARIYDKLGVRSRADLAEALAHASARR